MNNLDDRYGYSCLMSVYEKENPEWFRTSIESILNQTIKPSQIVIVCDGKLTDELYGIIDEYVEKYDDLFTIHYLEENVGLAKALNVGLAVCEHELVARMDTDDIALPTRCRKQLEVFEKNEVDIVGSSVYEFAEDPDDIIDIREVPCEYKDIVKYAKKRNPFNHPSVMYKKSFVLSYGGYQDYPFFEDYNLWATMLHGGARAINIKEPLLKMRTGGGLYKRRGGFKYAGYIWKFKKHLYKMGFLSLTQFLYSACGHIVVSIMPNSFRKFVYKKVLRKESK